MEQTQKTSVPVSNSSSNGKVSAPQSVLAAQPPAAVLPPTNNDFSLAKLKAEAGAPTRSGSSSRNKDEKRTYLRNGMIHVCYGKQCAGRAKDKTKATGKDGEIVKVLGEIKTSAGQLVGLEIEILSGVKEQWIMLDKSTLAPIV